MREVREHAAEIDAKLGKLDNSVELLVSELRHDRYERRTERSQGQKERDRIMGIAERALQVASRGEAIIEGRRGAWSSLRLWMPVLIGLTTFLAGAAAWISARFPAA